MVKAKRMYSSSVSIIGGTGCALPQLALQGYIEAFIWNKNNYSNELQEVSRAKKYIVNNTHSPRTLYPNKTFGATLSTPPYLAESSSYFLIVMGGNPTSTVSIAVIISIGPVIGDTAVRHVCLCVWGGRIRDPQVIAIIHNQNNDNDRSRFGRIRNTNLDHRVCNRGGGVGVPDSAYFPSYYFWIDSQIFSLVLSSPNDHKLIDFWVILSDVIVVFSISLPSLMPV